MEIKDDHFYPIKEAVILTGIKHRTLTRKASKMDARVIDGRYLLTGKQVKLLIEKQQEKKADLDKLVKIDTKALDKLVKNDGNRDNILAPDNDENEALKLEIKLLKAKLSEFDLKDNERIEIFTQTQYSEFEKRLKKYPEQQKVIEENKKIQLELSTKLEIKDVKIEHANESLKHYKESNEFWKSQAEYKDKQSEKFLEMHSKLIESVSNYSKASFIEATVKAKNTDWSKKKKPF